MTLERVTIAATLALAVIAQATVLGLLMSGWSVWDIHARFAMLTGRASDAPVRYLVRIVDFLLDFVIDTMKILTLKASAVALPLCEFFCNNTHLNMTSSHPCVRMHDSGDSFGCGLLGGILLYGATVVMCPLGVWLFFYAIYRSERSNKTKME